MDLKLALTVYRLLGWIEDIEREQSLPDILELRCFLLH